MSIEKSSGNVFADLGCDNPEELQAKAELICQIKERAKIVGDSAAMAILGVSKFSLLRSPFSKLVNTTTTEELKEWLEKLK